MIHLMASTILSNNRRATGKRVPRFGLLLWILRSGKAGDYPAVAAILAARFLLFASVARL